MGAPYGAAGTAAAVRDPGPGGPRGRGCRAVRGGHRPGVVRGPRSQARRRSPARDLFALAVLVLAGGTVLGLRAGDRSRVNGRSGSTPRRGSGRWSRSPRRSPTPGTRCAAHHRYVSPQIEHILGYTPREWAERRRPLAPRRRREPTRRTARRLVGGRPDRHAVPPGVPDAGEGRPRGLDPGRIELRGVLGRRHAAAGARGHVRHHAAEGGGGTSLRGRAAVPDPDRAAAGGHLHRGRGHEPHRVHQPADRDAVRLHVGGMAGGPGPVA